MIESPLIRHTGGYIDNHWVDADTGNTINVTNPATGELLATIPDMGQRETERAVIVARHHIEHIPTVATRRKWLQTIAELLKQHRDEIGRILTLEHGKPLSQATAEVDYAAGFFSHYANIIDQLKPRDLSENIKGCHWTVHFRPAGVAALITPWNFPIAMLAKKMSAALAAGCSCVIKPSSKTPLTVIALFELLIQHLPECAQRCQLLLGDAQTISDSLCDNINIDIISFTGSTRVGQSLITKTAHHVKKLALELGGNAPFIVFEDADIHLAASALADNKSRGSGQTCVCTNRVLVHEYIKQPFVDALSAILDRLKVGDGMNSETDIGPLIDKSGYDKVRHHLHNALDQGATLAYGERVPELQQDWGAFFPPVLITDVNRDMSCYRDEVFGPLISVAAFTTDGEALEMANDTDAGLAGYFFTQDEERIEAMLTGLRFGHVGVNTATGPTPEAPFGGMKTSGLGREGGLEGLMEFIEPQTVARNAP